MANPEFSQEKVEGWLAAVLGEIKEVHDSLRPLLSKKAKLQEREALLRDLLSSFEGEEATGKEAFWNPSSESLSPEVPEGRRSIRDYVIERTMEILEEEGGGPIHIDEIRKRFIERGFTIPGQGQPANIIVHIRQSDQIISAERGFYELAMAEPRKKATAS